MRKFMIMALVWAVPVLAQNPPVDLRTAAGCGPTKTQFEVVMGEHDQTVPVRSPGKAAVYVIEVQKPEGTGVTTRVGLDGNWMGANTGAAYMSFEVEPGDHHVCVDWQSSVRARQQAIAAAVVTAEAGERYYFVAEVLVGEPDLTLTEVDEAEGLALMSRYGKSAWKEKK